MRSKDKVEMHFDAPRVLANRFKRALAVSKFSTQAEFFRFHMIQFVESKEKAIHRGKRDEKQSSGP